MSCRYLTLGYIYKGTVLEIVTNSQQWLGFACNLLNCDQQLWQLQTSSAASDVHGLVGMLGASCLSILNRVMSPLAQDWVYLGTWDCRCCVLCSLHARACMLCSISMPPLLPSVCSLKNYCGLAITFLCSGPLLWREMQQTLLVSHSANDSYCLLIGLKRLSVHFFPSGISVMHMCWLVYFL